MNISVEVGPRPRLYSGQVGLLSIAPEPVRMRSPLGSTTSKPQCEAWSIEYGM